MPLLRINATSAGLALHDTPQPTTRKLKLRATHQGPAIIMIHGYKYRPGSAQHCPHAKIFGTADHNWPAQLCFSASGRPNGLGIAVGWDARGPLREVYRRAAHTAQSVAKIVAMLRQQAPSRPVHIVAHSLGSELALNALAHLPAGAVDRMILMTGASFEDRARAALSTPAGRTVEVLNITSRENDVFDAAFERLVPSDTPAARSIGQGIHAPNVTTLQLDCPETLSGLRAIGFDIAPPSRRICHWSAYKRPGVMTLYTAFLRSPESLPLERLANVIPPQADPRWSRLTFGLRRLLQDKRQSITPAAATRPSPTQTLAPIVLPASAQKEPAF